MGRWMFLVALLTTGCIGTPYQRSGFLGGYDEQPLGPGRWLVSVRVNGYTSGTTAMVYLHRRAHELCPAGYVFEDRMVDEGWSTVPRYNARSQSWGTSVVRKPSDAAVVRCNPTPTERRAEFVTEYQRNLAPYGIEVTPANAELDALVFQASGCGAGLLAALSTENLAILRNEGFTLLVCTKDGRRRDEEINLVTGARRVAEPTPAPAVIETMEPDPVAETQ